MSATRTRDGNRTTVKITSRTHRDAGPAYDLRSQPAGVPAVVCPHLGPATGELLTIRALCGCAANPQWKTVTLAICECAVNGRCAPHYRCAKKAVAEEVVEGEWAQPCLTCELNPLNKKESNDEPTN